MFKKLFIRIYRLIAKTTPTWQEVSNEQDRKNEAFYNTYLFPVVGVIALLSFIGMMMPFKSFEISNALKTVLKQVFIVGGSFYLNTFIISRWMFPCVDITPNRTLAERFTGYASALIFALTMLKSLFPGLFFLEILSIYTFYMVWIGAIEYLKIDDEQGYCFSFLGKKIEWAALPVFTFLAGMLLLGMPFFLRFLIEKLMPNF